MKERLTGAIILVALIVLLVPELLTGPIRTKHAHAPVAAVATLSTHAQPPLHTYTMTLTPGTPARDSLAAPAAQASPAVAESPAQAPDQGEEPQHAAGTAEPQAPAAAPLGPQRQLESGSGLQPVQTPAHPAVREARSAGSSGGGWVVQLGSFASRQNADRLARALSGRGFRMSVSPARAGTRVLWRVRAGPVPDRASAGRLAARLRALGHRGELLPVR